MGSFNASCAVSHCAINPGDPVKLIPIVSNNLVHYDDNSRMHLGFGCYTYDNFVIVGYPMDATYEDYGDFEVKKDMFSEYNLNIIRSNYTETLPEKGEKIETYDRERKGYGVKAEDLDWEMIGSMIHNGSLFLDSNSTQTNRKYMGFFPVHKCVYDLMMKRTPEMYFDNTYDTVNFDTYLKKHLKENEQKKQNSEYNALVVEFMDKFSHLIGEKNENGVYNTPEKILEMAESVAELRMSMNSDRHRRPFSYNNTTDIDAFNKYLKENKMDELTPKQHNELVTLDAEVIFFMCGLSAYNIQLIPPMTAGQEYDKTDHASFMIAAGQALLAMQQDRNDECEYNVRVDTKISVSLNTILEASKHDWKPERGKKRAEQIHEFAEKYPDGVVLTFDELNKEGYSLLLHDSQTTLFPIEFINDLEK